MSLNRILKSAQTLGMPVVITDRDGSSAQVVMPFDDFMALTQSSMPQKRGVASGGLEDLDFEEGEGAPFQAGEEMGQTDWDLSAFSDQSLEGEQDPFDFSIEAPMNGASEEISETEASASGMEEKFYLEPLDEGDVLK